MSYTIEGWQHGYGFGTIDLSNQLCCYCHEALGVIHQYQLTGCEFYKCGEFNYSEMAHSWCHAYADEYEAAFEDEAIGYQWFNDHSVTVQRWIAEREAEDG